MCVRKWTYSSDLFQNCNHCDILPPTPALRCKQEINMDGLDCHAKHIVWSRREAQRFHTQQRW